MISDSDRLIELATTPLAGDAELHLAGKAELTRQLETNHATPETVAVATAALEDSDRHPLRKYLRIALYLVTLLVSLPILFQNVRQLVHIAELRKFATPISLSVADYTLDSSTRNLDASQKLLLFGNPRESSKETQWKPLWDSDPTNPAFLAEYANAYYRDHKEFSPEILVAVSRIDPDNAIYPALRAASRLDAAVTKEKRSYMSPGNARDARDRQALTWTINNPEDLNAGLALIHEAAGKSKLTIYQEELLLQRIPLLPLREDFVSQMPAMVYLASQSNISIHLRKLVDALSAGAQDCAKRKDIAGFNQIIRDWYELSQMLATGGQTLIDLLVAKVFITAPLNNFRDAALSLGLGQEAQRYDKLHERFLQEKQARESSHKGSWNEDLASTRGSVLASLMIPMVARQVNSPPPLNAADFTPGRYADHAVFGRAASLAAWALLGIVAGLTALHRYSQSTLVRKLSTRTVDLLRPSDCVCILAGGILAPILWYFILTRFTPLSAREWSMRLTVFMHPALQFGALLAMLLVLPTVIAAWRLGKRGALLGLAPRHQWTGSLAAVCATLAVPVYGAIMIGRGGPIMTLGHILLGIALLWLCVGFCSTFFGRKLQALRRATLARTVLPAWIGGMLLFALAIPFHYAEERKWIQQDTLLAIPAGTIGPNRYEWEVTQTLRKELLQLLSADFLGSEVRD